ncbi:PIR Superfamily Protein [Plasmodium ovale curtisi]|uniref:PIR Superfamily Protein n=1 Tax=Plasmodium ovale curtisi TaxID=864141 RepID=A0A1A8WI22_PLAOA|nr:PIR Superfamily Protein [Plasmodium ovale curtisi]
MDANIKDSFFQKLGNSEEFLMNFDLYGIYKKFSQIYDYDKHVDSICNYYMQGNYESIGDIISVCQKIDRILKSSISYVSSDTTYTVNKYCEYLSYFLYEKIEKFSSNNNFFELYNTLNDARALYEFNSNNCNIINFHGKNGKFDKMKELYFRNEILQEIKNKYDRNFIDEKKFCKEYLLESADLYNEIMNNNFCKYDKYYREILNKFSTNFEETKNFLKRNGIEISDVNVLSTIPICESEEKNAPLAEALVSGLHGQQQVMDNPGKVTTDGTPSSTPDTGKNSIPGVVSGILIGTCSLFFIIYKFTPLGSSLHNKIWMTKKKFNLEDKSNELILEAADNESMDLYNSMYNIQYHSSQND